MSAKRCRGCDTAKPLDAFHRSSRNRDGRQSRCKDCQVGTVRSIRQRPGYGAGERRRARASAAARKAADAEYAFREKWRRAVADARQRAERSGAPHQPYTLTDLLAKFGPWQDWTCAYCHASDELTLEHLTPLAKGGADALANVHVACHACNTRKHDRGVGEWLRSDAFADRVHEGMAA